MAVSLFISKPGAQVDRWRRLDSRSLIWHFPLMYTVQLGNWLMIVGFTYRWSRLNLSTSLTTKMNSKISWASNLHSKQLANAHILWEQKKPRQKPHNFAQRFLLPSVLSKPPTGLSAESLSGSRILCFTTNSKRSAWFCRLLPKQNNIIRIKAEQLRKQCQRPRPTKAHWVLAKTLWPDYSTHALGWPALPPQGWVPQQ